MLLITLCAFYNISSIHVNNRFIVHYVQFFKSGSVCINKESVIFYWGVNLKAGEIYYDVLSKLR